ncbi:MAG: PBP1A family penicillin-binding protein [Tenericutes bacterium]|nr:PBP1A family penicillin-binding protein [Mycoplasmatota bacterium]
MKKCLFYLTTILLVLYGSLYVYAKFDNKISIKSANSFYMYDNNNEIFNKEDNWVSIKEISPNLINATISIEDKHFYNHVGFDYLRIMKAMTVNIKNMKNLEGASTITQQLAKNLFLDFDKTWERKIEEAWLTIKLESNFTKNEILEGYLNTINYGGVFGIENASIYYFGKSAKDLNLAEASILAGIPKSPSYYSPITNYDNAKMRQKIILNAMVNNKFINESEKEKAISEKLNIVGKYEKNNSNTLMYYQDAVIKELNSIKSIPKSFIKTGGLKIYTNLDLNTQIDLENNIEKYLKNDQDLQVASVMVNPNDGKIIALIGGRNYKKSEFNRAIESKRQVGSTLKPFLYYSALENGFTASTTFNSSKTTFVFSNDEKYSPKNYGDIYANKDITMAAALAYSDNIYAVKTHLFLGENNLVNMLNRIGITSNLSPVPSLALGTSEINIIDMTSSYSVFANNGYKIKPHLIEKIVDMNGKVLYEFNEEKKLILNQSTTYIMNELLSNCYNNVFVDYNYPTCINIASKVSNKYAIKTGTTDTDHLIFGYNPEIVLGIWSGYDNNDDTYPEVSTNIKLAWIDTIENYFKKNKATWYKKPDNIVGVPVNPITGELNTNKNTILYYIKGTEPTTNNELDEFIPTLKEETN